MGQGGRQTHMQDSHVTTAGLARGTATGDKTEPVARGVLQGSHNSKVCVLGKRNSELWVEGSWGKGCVRALLTLILTAADSV